MNYNQVHERAKLFTGKDKEMDKRLQRIAARTWDVIAGDILVDDYGRPDYKKTLQRSHVIEIVCDADYMLMHGGDEEAYAYFIYLRENHYNYRQKVIKEAFPYAKYGW